VSREPVTIAFAQAIGAREALDVGHYAKTLTFPLTTGTPHVARLNPEPTFPNGDAVRARACSGCGSEMEPLTRRPLAAAAGSATVSVASPAVDVTVAVVEAV
jgi:hypothetical protein